MDLVARLFAATFIADIGAGLGTAVGAMAPRRLHLMVWIAAGAMLAVVLFDVLPEALAVIGGPSLALAVLSGFGLLWVISRTVFHVCPSCAIAELGDGSGLGIGRGVPLILIALGIHSFLDGIGLVTEVGGRQDIGLLLGISLHKLPEGLALTLLLVGAGITRRRAFGLSLGIEMLTIVGGIVGSLVFRHLEPFWPAAVAANVAGGFLYLVWTTATSANKGSAPAPRPVLFMFGSLSFLLVGLFLLCCAR